GLLDDVDRGLLGPGRAPGDALVVGVRVVLAPVERVGVRDEPTGPVRVGALGALALPLVGLLLGEALVERLAVHLLPRGLAEVVRARPVGRGVALVEHVVHPAVQERVLRLELVVVALGACLRVRARAGRVFAHASTVAPRADRRSMCGMTCTDVPRALPWEGSCRRRSAGRARARRSRGTLQTAPGRRARPTTRTTMAGIDDIISSIPLDQLAGRLGVDEATAQQAVGAALPALLGGLQANAQDPAGAASLGEAITQHDPSLVEGGVDLDAVDTADGEK